MNEFETLLLAKQEQALAKSLVIQEKESRFRMAAAMETEARVQQQNEQVMEMNSRKEEINNKFLSHQERTTSTMVLVLYVDMAVALALWAIVFLLAYGYVL